jgi:hypothetical protein
LMISLVVTGSARHLIWCSVGWGTAETRPRMARSEMGARVENFIAKAGTGEGMTVSVESVYADAVGGC